MKLIFLRHGIAASKSPFQTDMDDFRRKLTHDGVIQTKEMSRNLRFLFKDIDTIFTSPLLRAVHTAQIIYRDFPHTMFELLPSLDKLCDPEVFVNEARQLDIRNNYCFVGHEPHLTTSIQLLLTESKQARLILPKSGVAVLEGKSFADLKINTLISPKTVKRINS